MTDAILLRRVNGLWHADHRGPHADEVERLFGTRMLPTPFSASVPSWKVQDRIAALNPGYHVVAER